MRIQLGKAIGVFFCVIGIVITPWLSLHSQAATPFDWVNVVGSWRIAWKFPFEFLQASRINNIRFVGLGFLGGTDIGAEINAAYADLPPTGGTIIVLPKEGGGSQKFNTQIAFTTPHKTVMLLCEGPAGTPNSGMNQGTVLEWTPTVPGAAIVFDNLDATGSGYTRANGVRDCALWNGHVFKPGGDGSAATGIQLGEKSMGGQLAEFTGDLIGGFGIGLSVPSSGDWGWTIDRSSIVYNTIGISARGENANITDSVIAANETGIEGDCPEINIKGGSIDSNTLAAINYTNEVGGCILNSDNVHYENLGLSSGTRGMPYIVGNPNLLLTNGVMIDDQISGDNTNGFIRIGTTAIIHGTQFVSSGRTETSGVIQITGSGVSRVYGEAYNQSPKILPAAPSKFIGGSQSQFASFAVISATSQVRTITQQYEGDLRIGTATATGGGGLQIVGTRLGFGMSGDAVLRADDSGDLNLSNNKHVFLRVGQLITTTFTTSAEASDKVVVTGMTPNGHCYLTPLNSRAAAGMTTVYVSSKRMDQITISHAPIAGWNFDVVCSPQ